MNELVVIGGSAQGLSTAVAARKAGAASVRVIETKNSVAYPEMVGNERLDVSYGEKILAITETDNGLLIKTDTREYPTQACVIALNSEHAVVDLPSGISTSSHVHAGPESLTHSIAGKDILVVGDNDRAVVLAARYVHEGARSVVLAARGMNPDLLSDASHDVIAQLEKDRQLTVLYRATPHTIDELDDGEPAVSFGDNRTPDLMFDEVVFAATQVLVEPHELGIEDSALESGRLMYVRDPRLDSPLPSGTCSHVIARLAQHFDNPLHDEIEKLSSRKRNYRSAPEELRKEFYNATITFFAHAHSDLWKLRVRPDKGDISHLPGQYSSLGLGFWEDRIDDAHDPDIEMNWDKLVLRSYSISNRIYNDQGYLASETENGELEFYIVLVPPTPGNIPGLTPRLALKEPGDRIFLGPKVTGRYTMKSVTDPHSPVLFFATGTGEAPHNSMIVQLLKNGHKGKIVSAVSVRNSKDLGYLSEHRRLEEEFSNYTYIPMPTREPNIPKRYCQDLVTSGELEEILGAPLDPATTHAFLCGNPSMIGIPELHEGKDVFPESVGVVQLLVERGFKFDRRKDPGNIHVEEFWKPKVPAV